MKHKLFLVLALFSIQTIAAQSYLQQAGEALDSGYIDKAYYLLKLQLEITPYNADAFTLLGHTYVHQGKEREAIEAYNSALSYCTKGNYCSKEYIYMRRGLCYQEIDSIQTAINDYSAAIKANKKYAEAYAYRAHAYWHINEAKKANADFRKYLKLEPKDASEYESYGRFLYSITNDAAVALPYINYAIKSDPTFSNAYYSRSIILYNAGEYELAIDAAMVHCALNDGKSYNHFVDCAQQNMGYAMEQINQCISNPDYEHAVWYGMRAQLYMQQKQYDAAIDDLCQQEVMIGGPNWYIAFYRALCYSNLGKHDEAIRDYTRAIDLEPAMKLYAYRASEYEQAEDYANAITDLSVVVEQYENPTAFAHRGWLKFITRNYQDAISDYTKAIELNDSDAHICRYYGYTLQVLGDTATGRVYLERALELEGESPTTTSLYALALLGRKTEAIDLLKQMPNANKLTHYDMACIYSLLNMPDEALLYLHLALENGLHRFTHIGYDTDLDNIRNLPEFKQLIDKYDK